MEWHAQYDKNKWKMTLTFDNNAYRNLLTEVIPVAIETEEEYERVLKVVEELTFKKNRTTEEHIQRF